jgi:MFS family permease
MTPLPRGLRALAHRNFRLFLAGQGTSQTGNWLQLIATSWLMYRLTESTFMLGLATFALQIPFLVLAPLAGVFLDRVDVRRVLFITNSIALLQAVVMFTLVAGGTIAPWHLVAGNFVLGVVNACDAPARQSLLVRLVDDRADLQNAIALNSTMMNFARFLGPMIGGAVIAAFGEVAGFALNSLLRFAVLAALAAMRLQARLTAAAIGGWLRQFATGLRYAYGFLPTRSALLLLAATSITTQSYSSLMPWFAKERFHGDSHTLGLLMSAAGLGAVSGMVYLASRQSVRGLFRLIGWTAALAGVALIAFSLVTNLWLALPMVYLTGMGMMLTAASTNTVLQTIVPDELRGRVAALYVMSFIGVSPLGALFAGWAAEHIGAPHTLLACGAVTLLCAGLYVAQMPLIRHAIRPVYERMGIVPRADT